MAGLELLIDQDECTSCQECTMIAPRHFFMANDGLAYVKEDSTADPEVPVLIGFGGRVAVTSELEEAVIEAAEYCPGECIYVYEQERK